MIVSEMCWKISGMPYSSGKQRRALTSCFLAEHMRISRSWNPKMVFNCSLHRSTLEMERSILVMTGTTSKCYYVEKRREIKEIHSLLQCDNWQGFGPERLERRPQEAVRLGRQIRNDRLRNWNQHALKNRRKRRRIPGVSIKLYK